MSRRVSFFARVLAAAFIVPFIFGIAQPAAASQSWSIDDLGTPFGVEIAPELFDSFAAAINNNGYVVGNTETNELIQHGFVWNSGTVYDLNPRVPANNSIVSTAGNAINNNEAVLGTFNQYCLGVPCSSGIFLMDAGGGFTNLSSQGMGAAVAVNDENQVVGCTASQCSDAALWQNGSTTDLGNLGASPSGAESVNNRGHVVGWSAGTWTNGYYNHAFLWQNGSMQDLGTLGGCTSVAYAINGIGQVVGVSDTAGTCYQGQAFIWQNGAMSELPGVSGCQSSAAYAINEEGQAVGTCYSIGVLWSGGQMIDLNSLLPANSGWRIATAAGINDRGQIVGSAFYQNVVHGYVLTPPTVPPNPYLNIGFPGGPRGVTLTVTGGGFEPNETVSLLGNCPRLSCTGAPTLATVQADAIGSIPPTQITLPANLGPGAYTIGASGSSGLTFTTAVYTVNPNLTVSPVAITPGSTVQLSGNGFQPNESVSLFGDCRSQNCGGPLLGQATADGGGNFSTTVSVPSLAGVGIHAIGALGQTSHAFQFAYETVTSAPVTIPATSSVAYQGNVRHDGFLTDPALNTPLQPLWSRDLGGAVDFPIVANGRVFVTVEARPGYGNATGATVYAFDAATGNVLWSRVLGPSPFTDAYLAYDNNRLFATSFSSPPIALDPATGNLLWQSSVGGEFFDTPMVADHGVIYLTTDGISGGVYAVSEATGKVIWSTINVISGTRSSPALDSNAVYVDLDNCPTAALNRTTGALIWEDGKCDGASGLAPTLHLGKLFSRQIQNLHNVGQILDTATGAKLGSFNSGPPPAFYGNIEVLVLNGTVSAQDLQGNPLWTFTGDHGVDSPPLIVNDKVYVGSIDGNLYTLALTNGQLLDQKRVGIDIPSPGESDGPITGFGAGDGYFFVVANSRLMAFR